jgi:hypothetical protein
VGDVVLRGVAGWGVEWSGARLSPVRAHPQVVIPAEGDPVRRGFSVQSLASVEYWIAAGACHRAAIRPTRWRR